MWIPWAVGFALHMQFCLTSFFISIVCVRDMYNFRPIVFTRGNLLQSIGGSLDNRTNQTFLPMEPNASASTTTTTNRVAVITVLPPDGNNNGLDSETNPRRNKEHFGFSSCFDI